jgi:hypothetical protein
MQSWRKAQRLTDGVNTTAGASVTAGGAARSRGGLRGSVGDRVTGGGAAALEGVVETNPVTNFVSGSLVKRSTSGSFKRERGRAKLLTWPKLKGEAVPPGTEEWRMTTPSSLGALL